MTTERLTCIYVPIYVPVLQVDLIVFGSLEVEVKAKSTAGVKSLDFLNVELV